MNMETEPNVKSNLTQQQSLLHHQQQLHQQQLHHNLSLNQTKNLTGQQPLPAQSQQLTKQKKRSDDLCTNSSMDKNKELLNVKLMSRRSIQQLVDQGIIPPPKQSPGIYEQTKKLERARTEDFLKHKIQRRPDRQALIQQHILEDTSVSPTIHNKQRQLKKARLTYDLNDRLSHRPGPLELVKGNILLTDNKFAQAVKEGQIQFKATSEGEPIKNPPPRFIIEEETSSDDSVSLLSSSSASTILPTFTTTVNTSTSSTNLIPNVIATLTTTSNTSGVNTINIPTNNNSNPNNQQCPPQPLSNPMETTMNINSSPQLPSTLTNSPATISSSAFSNLTSLSSPPSSSSSPSTTVTRENTATGLILTKNRKKSKSKSQPKTKTIKFHEYKGPPSAQKNQSSANNNTESSYELLLKQQQLFLQLQLEWQNKYPQIILPSTQKNMDQGSVTGTLTSTNNNNNNANSNNSSSNSSNNNSNCSNIGNSSTSITAATASGTNIGTLNGSSATSSSNNNSNGNNQNSTSTPSGTTATMVINLNGGNIVGSSSSTTNSITTSTRSSVELNCAHPNSNILSSAQHPSIVNGINLGSNNNSNFNNSNNSTNNANVNSVASSENGTAKIILKLEDMKVSDLKCELKRRNLPVSGSKPQLIERLKPHLEMQRQQLSNGLKMNVKDADGDDPMSPVNPENDSNKAKGLRGSPVSTPMELDYSAAPEVAIADDLQKIQLKRMADFQKANNRQPQLQQQPTNQPSFQLQFQNQSVFASPSQSVTIPLSALANSQLQIVTTSPTTLIDSSNESKSHQFITTATPGPTSLGNPAGTQGKLNSVNPLNPSQTANLAAIISPGNASATVKANLAAFLQQHQQQQQQQAAQQQQQAIQHHIQLQHHQQQQQQQQLQASLSSSSICLTNTIPVADLTRSADGHSFEPTSLLLTSKVCDTHQFTQSLTDPNQSQAQQLHHQATGVTANITGDNRFQLTSDSSNKYHLAIKQSTFSLPLLTQVIDSKNSFPTFHQFLLYPSSLNRSADQLQLTPQPQQQPISIQSQHQPHQHHLQPILPNLGRVKQTRTNSLPSELLTKSVSQRTTSLPDFSSLIKIKTEPNAKSNPTQHQPLHQHQQQSQRKSPSSAQNHLLHQHLPPHQPPHQQQQQPTNQNSSQNQNQNLIQQQQGQPLPSAKPPPDYEEATKEIYSTREEAKKMNQSEAIDDVLEILMKSEDLSMTITSTPAHLNRSSAKGIPNRNGNPAQMKSNNPKSGAENYDAEDGINVKEKKKANEETLDSSSSSSFFLCSSPTASPGMECQTKVILSSSPSSPSTTPPSTTTVTVTTTVKETTKTTSDMDEKMDDSNLEKMFTKGLEEIANSVCMSSPLMSNHQDHNNNNSNVINEEDIETMKSSPSSTATHSTSTASSSLSSSLTSPSTLTITNITNLKNDEDDHHSHHHDNDFVGHNMMLEINDKMFVKEMNDHDHEMMNINNSEKRNTFDSTASSDLLFNELLDFQGSPMNVDYTNWLADLIPDHTSSSSTGSLFKTTGNLPTTTTTLTPSSIGEGANFSSPSFSSSSTPPSSLIHPVPVDNENKPNSNHNHLGSSFTSTLPSSISSLLFNHDSNSIDNLNNKLRTSHPTSTTMNLNINNSLLSLNNHNNNNYYSKPSHHLHNHHVSHYNHNPSLYPVKQHPFSSPFNTSPIITSSSSSATTPTTTSSATSMDHDPVLANNLAESCHYGDPLIDLYFDTESECRESNDLTSLGVWDKVDFAT